MVDTAYLLANHIHYVLTVGLGVWKWYLTAWPAYSRAYVFYNIIDILRNCSVLLTLAVTVERLVTYNLSHSSCHRTSGQSPNVIEPLCRIENLQRLYQDRSRPLVCIGMQTIDQFARAGSL